ncbi:hypothetical protein [Micromonospora sp. NPDC049274]|uniref:hypothetical protein n=1 Tax=Micromonospora sp. NPDC049274 TaxID=3154829 RepID=UPI00343EA93F
MGDTMYCKHDRLAASCEDCQFVAALEKGRPDAVRLAQGIDGTPDHTPVNASEPEELETVDEDTQIMRPDLDRDLDTKGTYTLIRAGEQVPAELADFPRQPGSYKGPVTKASKPRTPTIA